MSHSKEIIDRAVGLVRADYSETDYVLLIERGLVVAGVESRRYQPDIQVFAASGRGRVPLCTVEIGYTRPEKLDHYKQIGIPDVRWYSKEGQLFAPSPVVATKLITKRTTRIVDTRPDPTDSWRVVEIQGDLCPNLANRLRTMFDEFESNAGLSRFAKLRQIAGIHDDLYEHYVDDWCDNKARQTIIDLAHPDSAVATETLIGILEIDQPGSSTSSIRNGVYLFGVLFATSAGTLRSSTN